MFHAISKLPLRFASCTQAAACVALATVATVATVSRAQTGLAGPYIDPAYLTAVPFGSHSHWLQPWRAYQQTVPAWRFLDAQGVVLDGDDSENFDLVCEMLAKHGIRHARIEIGFGDINWNDETKVNNSIGLRRRLLACRKHGIRPLILLNANSGVPGPVRFFDRTIASSAHKGDRSAELTDASSLRVGYSGFANVTDYRASEVIVTAVEGRRVTLSIPLPKDLGEAGTVVHMSTLKYRPFGPPDSEDYHTTLDAWTRYEGAVARFVADTLDTRGAADMGFDMEIWNELSFGSSFLHINAYYDPAPSYYDDNSVYARVVAATAEYATAHPADFRGVRFVDGFRNTIPWPAASTEPPRVSAMSSHPYAGRKTYPRDDQHGSRIDALGRADTSAFVPSYSVDFPEYYATYLQTETVLRDMGPIPNGIGATVHGINTRVASGKPLPCPLWFTEIGFAPRENGITERTAALAIKAKTTDRYECLSIGKGLERIYFFSAFGGDTWLGTVQDNFVEYAKHHDTYPRDDAPYVSPMLRVIGNLVSHMGIGADPKLIAARPITVESITDTHDHFQFQGDGTLAHPTLYNREVLAVLPFQVNARRFVIPFYVMTRDVTLSLPPEQYRLTLAGLHVKGATFSSYDPITGVTTPVRAEPHGAVAVTLAITSTDYPRLLTIQER